MLKLKPNIPFHHSARSTVRSCTFPVHRGPLGSCPVGSSPWYSCSSAARPPRNRLCRWAGSHCSAGCMSFDFDCCPRSCARRRVPNCVFSAEYIIHTRGVMTVCWVYSNAAKILAYLHYTIVYSNLPRGALTDCTSIRISISIPIECLIYLCWLPVHKLSRDEKKWMVRCETPAHETNGTK